MLCLWYESQESLSAGRTFLHKSSATLEEVPVPDNAAECDLILAVPGRFGVEDLGALLMVWSHSPRVGRAPEFLI
jgi:hypothetical protein